MNVQIEIGVRLCIAIFGVGFMIFAAVVSKKDKK